MTLLVFELPGGWVEEVCVNLGVLTIVLHPVVENGVCRGNETSDDIGDWEHMFIEFLGFSVFVHSAQDISHDVCLPRDVVNIKIKILESVQHIIWRGDGFAMV